MMSRHDGHAWLVWVAAMLLVAEVPVVSAQDPLDSATLAPESARKSDEPADAGPSLPAASADGAVKPKPKPEFIVKSPAEWRALLPRLEYAVTREKATELPFSGKYATGHFKGTFVCAACDAAHVESDLFSSQHKFDSGTGWPSFYQPVEKSALRTAADYSEAEPRVEVACRRCGAHLGHVFDDGPPPTGLRFCINSVAIKLKTPEKPSLPRVAAGKSASKAKAKVTPKSDTTHASKAAGDNAAAASTSAARPQAARDDAKAAPEAGGPKP